MKMKCTQCGCDDLEEVDFPYEAKLDEVAVGIAGPIRDRDGRQAGDVDVDAVLLRVRRQRLDLPPQGLVLLPERVGAAAGCQRQTEGQRGQQGLYPSHTVPPHCFPSTSRRM